MKPGFFASIVPAFLLCLGVRLHAETVTFEVPGDLDGYTVTRTNTTDTTLTQGAAFGAGNPITGGLQHEATTLSDRTSLAIKTIPGVGAYTQWSQSILISPREVDDIASGEKKAELRLGFSATNTTTGNLKEYFHKTNHSFNVKLKAEHKPSDSSKIKNLEIEAANNSPAGQDVKFGKVTLNNSAHIDSWLRLTFIANRSSATGFDLSFKLESLGPDGTSAPVELAYQSQANTVNTTLAAAGQIYVGFSTNTEKIAGNRVYFDDHTISLTAQAPPAPAAATATNVNAYGFTANWAAGSGGYTAGYVLEVSKQSDNFAANKFIAADGTPDQAAGISISNGAAVSQLIEGLNPLTAYVYRLKATNGAGASAASNVITANTLSDAANVPPTLDPISNPPPIPLNSVPQVVNLTGISPGFGDNAQNVVVTALSNNTAVVPHPVVTYNTPDATGTVTFAPGGTEGTAIITVKVDDGQALDHSITRTFTVTVRTPPVELNFASATELSEFNISTQNGVLNHGAAFGIGAPPGGGLSFANTTLGSEPATLAMRTQPYPGPNPTLMRSSIFVNAKQMNNSLTAKGKAEVRLGFADSVANIPSEYKKFFEQGRNAISVQLNIEHDPSDAGKFHSMKAKMMSYTGSNKTESVELAASNAETFDHWLKLTFEAVAVGSAQVSMTVKLEDYGEDGLIQQGVVFQSSAFLAVNSGLLAAPWIHAGFMATTEKATLEPMFLDNHRVEVLSLPPDAPTSTAASLVTPSAISANWVPAGGSYASTFMLEVSKVSDNFAPNTFIAADGSTGQSAGITLPFPDLRTKRIIGLLPSTAYRYRVKSSNIAGASAYSNVIDVTTLAPGQNAAPTIDVIADPPTLVVNSGEQTVLMTGITNGGEDPMSQGVIVTAQSNNTALIPHPTVDYFDPETVGQLFCTPVFGATGSATITVTVQDSSGTINNTVTRTFTISVVTPTPLVNFGSGADLTNYLIQSTQAGLASNATGGIGGGGGLDFTREATNAEHVAIALRNQVYDARSASYLSSSIMLNLSQMTSIVSGKDKLDFMLGFIGGTTPASNYKDTFNKMHPALGVKLKLEHEIGSTEKDRKFEVELFSGPNDVKSGKETIQPLTIGNHWLKVEFFAVRAGFDRYYTSYIVSDCGLDGTATPVPVLYSGQQLFVNTSFFNDSSIYAGFQLNGEKSAHTTLKLDEHEVVVNTTAADAPENLAATDITSSGFKANWAASPVGREASGFVLEVSPLASNFAPNSFVSAAGVGGQAQGITINNPSAETLTLTGLPSGTSYTYRVRSVLNSEQSAVQPAKQAQVLNPPVGMTFAGWKSTNFPGQVGNANVSGAAADPDHDGYNNAMEFAFGMNPVVHDSGSATIVDATSGTKLRVTYRRRANTSSVVYAPKACGALDNWSPDGITTLSVSPVDGSGMETVVVEDSELMSASAQRFMRVEVQVIE